MIGTIIVIAKEPLPGRAKTRLVPPLTYEQAAQVAAAALTDTVRAVDAVPAHRRLLAFDGAVNGWLAPGWRASAQPPGDLDSRLVAAFAAAPVGPAVLVGMDTPQLRADHLGFDAEHYDACLGPARDGGYWAIGFRDPSHAAAAITGVPMSSAHTGAEQLRRLHALGLRVQLLPELVDVDDTDSARHVAALAPHTAFAAALGDLALRAG